MKRLLLLVAPLLLLLGFGVAAAQDDATTVTVAETDELGEFLVDAEGMTLYLFTEDTEPGVSTCEGGCLDNWPAFVAEDPLTLPDGVPGELTQIERSDGSLQVAYNGMPLYSFAGDQAVGDTTGQALGDVWYVVEPAEAGAAASPVASPAASPAASPVADGGATVTLVEDDQGAYFVDAEGMALYLFTEDMPGMSMCEGGCLESWPAFTAEEPLTLPEGVVGELTTFEREDGTQQVMYNDYPLYSFVSDTAAGDTTGQAVGDVWYLVTPMEPGDIPALVPAS